jgi:hypothetical protein
MNWYGSRAKRLLGALNKNFIDDHLTPKIGAVTKAVQKFLDEAHFVTADGVRRTASRVDDMRGEIVGGFRDLRDLLADRLDMFRLGGLAGDHLGSVQEHYTHGMLKELPVFLSDAFRKRGYL